MGSPDFLGGFSAEPKNGAPKSGAPKRSTDFLGGFSGAPKRSSDFLRGFSGAPKSGEGVLGRGPKNMSSSFSSSSKIEIVETGGLGAA